MYAKHRKKPGKKSSLLVCLASFAVLIAVVAALVGCQDSGGAAAASASDKSSDSRSGQDGRTPEEPNDPGPLRPDHKHPAFEERIGERQKMVAAQIQARRVKDPNVLKAMRIVPRHALIPKSQQSYAYTDQPRPIGQGQTISQPYIVAFMTEALALDPNDTVLEIGTGSGYQAAVCAEIAREVYTIEIVPELAESAAKQLKKLGYRNVFVKAGDGYFGWPEKAPFDAVIGTAAAGRVPAPLLDQLKPGGKMILPLTGKLGYEYLELLTKDKTGTITRKKVMPVRFVPMTGRVREPEKKDPR
ncbi:MAG: protein-L-isoaspartate(D-aspartate) O-methyltransferase [Sedimentisphaerales bacterium]|nr:protein-L-isoaspartate(D-aspartate) O-methyltransferase [Sedimentisphaerales bacterium]